MYWFGSSFQIPWTCFFRFVFFIRKAAAGKESTSKRRTQLVCPGRERRGDLLQPEDQRPTVSRRLSTMGLPHGTRFCHNSLNHLATGDFKAKLFYPLVDLFLHHRVLRAKEIDGRGNGAGVSAAFDRHPWTVHLRSHPGRSGRRWLLFLPPAGPGRPRDRQ